MFQKVGFIICPITEWAKYLVTMLFILKSLTICSCYIIWLEIYCIMLSVYITIYEWFVLPDFYCSNVIISAMLFNLPLTLSIL